MSLAAVRDAHVKQAGLFSAILTAFLIASLVLLQPDPSQTSVQLLSLIALQNGAPSRVQPFLNDTAESLPTSTEFDVPTSVAAINTLWFMSLVISLAAALFGILAKQWCREYLRWHSVNAPARENVLLRQVRFEAWERWGVASLIAAVPALLEIALILFLVGLLIFVPMFSQRSFTIVISATIGIILLGVIGLTVLPVFSRLCPFQSPTGWAFIRVKDLLRRLFVQLSWLLVGIILRLKGFEHRNIDNEWVLFITRRVEHWILTAEKLSDWRGYNLRAVTDIDLCRRASRTFNLEQACSELRAAYDTVCVDVVQTQLLIRALSWIQRGSSSDECARAAIMACASSVHAPFIAQERSSLERPHFLSSMLAICPTNPLIFRAMARSHLYDVSGDHIALRSGQQPSFERCGLFMTDMRDRHDLQFGHADQVMSAVWETDRATYEICCAMIRSDLHVLASDWVAGADPRLVEQTTRRTIGERIVILLCLLRYLPDDYFLGNHEGLCQASTESLAETSQDLFQTLAPHTAAHSTGLLSTLIHLAISLGSVRSNREGGERYITSSLCFIVVAVQCILTSLPVTAAWLRSDNKHWVVSRCATVAVDVYRSSDDYKDRNSRHLFVELVHHVFEALRLELSGSPEDTTGFRVALSPILDLLKSMASALRWSLMTGHRNCGAYAPLPWIQGFLQCYEAEEELRHKNPAEKREVPVEKTPFTASSNLRLAFFLVLRLLQACLDRQLITADRAAEDFERLLMLLRDPVLPVLPAELMPDAIAAQRQAASQIQDTLKVGQCRPYLCASLTLRITQVSASAEHPDIDDDLGSVWSGSLVGSSSVSVRRADTPPATRPDMPARPPRWDFNPHSSAEDVHAESPDQLHSTVTMPPHLMKLFRLRLEPDNSMPVPSRIAPGYRGRIHVPQRSSSSSSSMSSDYPLPMLPLPPTSTRRSWWQQWRPRALGILPQFSSSVAAVTTPPSSSPPTDTNASSDRSRSSITVESAARAVPSPSFLSIISTLESSNHPLDPLIRGDEPSRDADREPTPGEESEINLAEALASESTTSFVGPRISTETGIASDHPSRASARSRLTTSTSRKNAQTEGLHQVQNIDISANLVPATALAENYNPRLHNAQSPSSVTSGDRFTRTAVTVSTGSCGCRSESQLDFAESDTEASTRTSGYADSVSSPV